MLLFSCLNDECVSYAPLHEKLFVDFASAMRGAFGRDKGTRPPYAGFVMSMK